MATRSAQIIAQTWLENIEAVRAVGDYPGVLYVSLGDWNTVAEATGAPKMEARLPQVAIFMENQVMVVPDLHDGVAYLGKRIMP